MWTLPIGDRLAAATRVTHRFDRLERDVALPRQQKVTWKSGDGTTIEGMLFYPVDYQAGPPLSARRADARRPVRVRQVRRRVGAASRTTWPVLAGKGYAVLRPNYRGSTGYGNAFFRDVVERLLPAT